MTLATLARQVARDVRRDLGWIVLYGVLMSCAAYALVLMAVNHALVADKSAATELFLERGAQTVTLSDVPARAAGGRAGGGCRVRRGRIPRHGGAACGPSRLAAAACGGTAGSQGDERSMTWR